MYKIYKRIIDGAFEKHYWIASAVSSTEAIKIAEVLRERRPSDDIFIRKPDERINNDVS